MVLEIMVTLRTYLMGLDEMAYSPLLLFVISRLLSLKIIYQSLKKRSSTSHP